MATQNEIWEIIARVKGDADVAKLQKQVDKLNTELEKYEKILAKQKRPKNQQATANEIARVTDELKKVQKELDQAEKSVSRFGRVGKGGAADFSQGLLQASYAIDDVQYGIRGILNNITPTIQALGGAAGLAGAVSIAAVALKVLVDHWDDIEALWGNSKAKTEAEIVEKLGKTIALTAKEVERYYTLKKKLEDEDKARGAFKGELGKGTPAQSAAASDLSRRVAERGDLATGETGASRLEKLLSGNAEANVAPIVPIDPATTQKMSDLKGKISEQLQKINKIAGDQTTIWTRTAAGMVELQKGDKGYEKAKREELAAQKRQLDLLQGESAKLYEEEVKTKLAAFLGKLFENPGTEDVRKVQDYLDNFINAIDRDLKAGKITEAQANSAKAQAENFKKDLSKSSPDVMRQRLTDEKVDAQLKAKKDVNDKVQEHANLTTDDLPKNIQAMVDAVNKPGQEAEEVQRLAKKAGEALDDEIKAIRDQQASADRDKSMRDRLAQFESALRSLSDAGVGALTTDLEKQAKDLRTKFEDAAPTGVGIKEFDAQADELQQAIEKRKDEFTRKQKLTTDALRDIPGLRKEIQDDIEKLGPALAEDRLRRRVQEVGKGAGVELDSAEAQGIAHKEFGDASKAFQEGAAGRLLDKAPGLDESLQNSIMQKMLRGASDAQIRKMLIPQLSAKVKAEGGPDMTGEQADLQATGILEDALKNVGQMIARTALAPGEQQDMQKRDNSPEFVGLREYAQKLQTEAGKKDDVPQKQLDVQKQTLQAILQLRPDLARQAVPTFR